jgi:hypothetical protein
LSDVTVVISDGAAGSSGGEVGCAGGLEQAKKSDTMARIEIMIKCVFVLSDKFMFFNISLSL